MWQMPWCPSANGWAQEFVHARWPHKPDTSNRRDQNSLSHGQSTYTTKSDTSKMRMQDSFFKRTIDFFTSIWRTSTLKTNSFFITKRTLQSHTGFQRATAQSWWTNTSAGTTDFWKYCKRQEILRRVYTRDRQELYSPQQGFQFQEIETSQWRPLLGGHDGMSLHSDGRDGRTLQSGVATIPSKEEDMQESGSPQPRKRQQELRRPQRRRKRLHRWRLRGTKSLFRQ